MIQGAYFVAIVGNKYVSEMESGEHEKEKSGQNIRLDEGSD